jgi:hypothetical protein
MVTSADYRGWAGKQHGWRYIAQRIDGSGQPGIWLDNELPLHGVKITDVLSGPPQMTATIDPVYLRDRLVDRTPLLTEHNTMIYAEQDGEIRYGGLLMGADPSGPQLALDCSGMSGYPQGKPYPGNDSFVQVDAFDIVRRAWQVLQADQDGNLGLLVSNARSGILVGTPAATTPVTGTASSSGATAPAVASPDDGPYVLNWWGTSDLGSEIDKLAASAPFDYHERHVWNTSKTVISHYLDLGYPTLGQRRDKLRFVLGENIFTPPDAEPNAEYANEVIVLGAGDGSAMIRATARVRDGRVRTTAQLSDTSITSTAQAAYVARLELARRNQRTELSSVAIRNSRMTPIGSFVVGDEIRVQAEDPGGWGDVDMWCRVTSLDTTPDNPDIQIASLIRTDWVAV